MAYEGCPDFQRHKVYAWEASHVNGMDRARVPFSNIQAVVDHVWSDMGLLYPPRVRAMPKQKTTAAGDANRLSVRFHEHGATTITILHELAHSMTMDVEGAGFMHGPGFVGVYMKLLDKYIPAANLPMLMHTANISKVQFNILQGPTILDQD